MRASGANRNDCKKLTAFSLSIALVVVLWEVFLHNIMYGVPFSCSLRNSQQFIKILCFEYKQNRLSGSLCSPLCSKEITVTKCLGHGVKPHVLEAKWKDKRIVLKSESPIPDFHEYLPKVQDKGKFKMKVKYLLQYINTTIHEMAKRKSKSSLMYKVAGIIAEECDVGMDGILGYDEVKMCMQLATTREYLYLLLLQGNTATVDVYGTCGTMYGVQYVASDEFYATLSSLYDDTTWDIRAKIVSAVLDMITELRNTSLGELYLCDMRKSNIGLVRKKNGKIVAKAIDTDSVVFKEYLDWHMQFKVGISCQSDSMCGYMYCRATCDKETMTCTGRPTSSNLLHVCQRFVRPVSIFDRDMLNAPPSHIKDKLELTLKTCEETGNEHDINEEELIKQLKLLLDKSDII